MQVAQKQASPGSVRPRRLSLRVSKSDVLPWLIVGLLTLIGVALRLAVANQPLFADELSTYWLITDHGFLDLFSAVHSNAEITPPLYFVAAWATAHLSHAEELVRAPSLVAGTVTIPLVYLLGVRTVGRPAALVAAALTTFSPFMVYYSAEARAYAVMMLFVVGSTLALLLALDSGRARWWIAYALCSCLAMYSHYTCAFLLAAQLVWTLWAHPSARRAAILANLGAFVLFLPWATGVRKDLTSPTSDLLSLLSPFTVDTVSSNLVHWTFAHPYPYVPIDGMPGVVPLALGAGGVLIALAGCLANRIHRHRQRGSPALMERHRRVLLVVVLAASVPLGTVLASVVGNNIFGVRNLAASWPALALCVGALIAAAGPRLRYLAAALILLAFVIAGVKMLDDDYVRPNHRETAEFIEREIRPGEPVIDATALISPGPLSTLDTTIDPRIPLFRAGAPVRTDHPFNFNDPIVTTDEAFLQAATAAAGKRIFYVSTEAPDTPGYAQRKQALSVKGSRSGYRLVSTRTFPGFVKAQVDIFEPRE